MVTEKAGEPAPSPRRNNDDPDEVTMNRQRSNASSIWATETMSLPREAALVFVVCMAQLTTQAAFIGTLVLLEDVGHSFGVESPPKLAWLVGGYSLTVGTFILFSGRLGDVFGYKKIFVIGYAWFSLWSMVSGVSVYSNFVLAVFARVLQGIGPALCLPNALAIFGVAYPPGHRKAMVFSFFGAVAPIGGVAGGVFASLFNLAWWPWSQWALAICTACLAAIAMYAVPDMPRKTQPHRNFKSTIEDLDLPGAVTGIIALVLFNFAWTQAPVSGWGTPTVLVPLILGLILFGVFAYVEFKVSPRPLLPYNVINSNVAFVLAGVVCGWATFGLWMLYLVQMLEDSRGLSPLLTITWLVPVAVSGAAASVVTGKLLGPLNVKPPIVMSMASTAFLVGIILTATAPVDQIYWGQIFVSILIMPFGMDMSFPAATLILSDSVAKENQGIGASLVNTVVNYGIALGVGFAGTVDSQVNNGGKTSSERLAGYRGAMYMGIGIGGLGWFVSLTFLLKHQFQKKKEVSAAETTQSDTQA